MLTRNIPYKYFKSLVEVLLFTLFIIRLTQGMIWTESYKKQNGHRTQHEHMCAQ